MPKISHLSTMWPVRLPDCVRAASGCSRVVDKLCTHGNVQPEVWSSEIICHSTLTWQSWQRSHRLTVQAVRQRRMHKEQGQDRSFTLTIPGRTENHQTTVKKKDFICQSVFSSSKQKSPNSRLLNYHQKYNLYMSYLYLLPNNRTKILIFFIN